MSRLPRLGLAAVTLISLTLADEAMSADIAHGVVNPAVSGGERDSTGCPHGFQGRCRCGDAVYLHEIKYITNCTNTYFSDAVPLRSLPQETQVLIFSGNDLGILPDNIFGNSHDYPNLETIDLSNNRIKEIRGRTFHRVASVRTLILNHNDLYIVDTKQHPRIFSSFVRLESLHLTNAFTDLVDADWYMSSLQVIFRVSRLTRLTKLHLEQNGVWRLRDPLAFCQLDSLQHLYLGSNRLTDIDFRLDCLDQLTHLDLEHNTIGRLGVNATSQLDRATTRRPSFTANLQGNPFSCDCRTRSFLNWLNATRTRLLHRENYRCSNYTMPLLNRGKRLDSVKDLQCDSALTTAASSGQTSAVTMALCAITSFCCILLVALLVYKRKRLSQRARTVQPQIHEVIQYVKRSRQYTSIEPDEDAVEVHV